MYPEIILGSPGCGKTTALIGVVEKELARGTPPDRIGYISFTRKAASEATGRTCEKFRLTRQDFPHFSTIHSLCFRQLGMKRGDVLEGVRVQEFARHVGVRIDGKWSEDGTMTGIGLGDRIMFMENLARIRGIPLRRAYDADDDGLPWSEVSRVSRALAEFKRARGLMDFTDMILEFVRSRIRVKLTLLAVDEAQDLSSAQWRVVERLAEGCERVAVAGDDDQALFEWAGADVDHLIDMPGDVRVLGQSWRVPPVVQRMARGVIDQVKKRRPKTWKARTGGEGSVDRATVFGDVELGDQTVLVLARNTYLLTKQVIPELRRRGVVYEYHGHSSVRAGLLEAVRDWERLRRHQRVTASAVRRIYEWMTSGRGVARGSKTLPGRPDDEEVSLVELAERGGLLTEAPWFEAMDRIPADEVSYLRAARQRGEKLGDKPRVVVSTVHGAKGGEADHVVLLKELAFRTNSEMRSSPDDERRVAYVGLTRARERLTIVESSSGMKWPWI